MPTLPAGGGLGHGIHVQRVVRCGVNQICLAKDRTKDGKWLASFCFKRKQRLLAFFAILLWRWKLEAIGVSSMTPSFHLPDV